MNDIGGAASVSPRGELPHDGREFAGGCVPSALVPLVLRYASEVEMTKRSDDESSVTGAVGGYAIGGAGLASASLLGGILGEGDTRSHDLGPAPIGSDPWLMTEVRAAIARERGVDATRVVVEARDANVTLRGAATASDAVRIESAARSVQGIKTLRVELASA